MTFWSVLVSVFPWLSRPVPKPKRRYHRRICEDCSLDYAVTKDGKPVHPHRCKGPGGAA